MSHRNEPGMPDTILQAMRELWKAELIDAANTTNESRWLRNNAEDNLLDTIEAEARRVSKRLAIRSVKT